MEQKQLRFSDGDISRLTQLLEGCEGVRVRCCREMSGIWFSSDESDMELRLLLLMNFRLTVSRVLFAHRRQGTMTKVLAFLENFCKEHNIPEIVIQSVETKEMSNWCRKNHFQPNPSASIQIHDFIMGDYRKYIE